MKLVIAIVLVQIFMFQNASSTFLNTSAASVDLHFSIGTGQWCQSWKNLMCASDGVTYWNECLLRMTQARRPDIQSHEPGVCDSSVCKECDDEPPELHFCTSNNMLLQNICMFKCLLEEYPKVTEDPLGCRTKYPTVAEMEASTPDHFTSMMDDFLRKSYESESMEGESGLQVLKSFKGYIYHKTVIYKINAKRGYMTEIPSLYTPDSFFFSAEVPARTKWMLQTGTISAGYKYLRILSGGHNIRTNISISIQNATLQLVADPEAYKEGCVRLRPVEVRLIQLTTVKMTLNTQGELPDAFPKVDLEGFMKEHFVHRINEGIEASLYARMNRVGCLKWPHGQNDKCFGAFQIRFCSANETLQIPTSYPQLTSTSVPPDSL